MFRFTISIKGLVLGTLLALFAVGMPAQALAKLYKVKCPAGDLQKTIDATVNGDTIELTGICMASVSIVSKDLTLIGATTPGPHGINGVATDKAALTISRSNATTLQNLSFSNGALQGVVARNSTVSMINCELSNNTGSGIQALDGSYLIGEKIRIDNNASVGLWARRGSRIDCRECDLNGNLFNAARSQDSSLLTRLDSSVTGGNGLLALSHSYADIDCQSWVSSHTCSLNATNRAGWASEHSTVSFYGAGDFWGKILADSQSEAQLYGARQQSTGVNSIENGASLLVQPYPNDGTPDLETSRLQGTTNVSGFSHAQLYGDSTVLDGSLNCSAAGDAWVEASVDLAVGASINGCEHVP